MKILIQDIQQANGFRVREHIDQEVSNDNQLHAFCTHSGGSVRTRMPEVSSSAMTPNTPLCAR
jgi:hypothetical protein